MTAANGNAIIVADLMHFAQSRVRWLDAADEGVRSDALMFSKFFAWESSNPLRVARWPAPRDDPNPGNRTRAPRKVRPRRGYMSLRT